MLLISGWWRYSPQTMKPPSATAGATLSCAGNEHWPLMKRRRVEVARPAEHRSAHQVETIATGSTVRRFGAVPIGAAGAVRGEGAF